jgi:PAS domain-containing protein
MDKRFVRKDGKVINAMTDVRAVRHEDGRVDFFVATVQDITARLQAEGFAQEVLDNVHQGFVVYDRALRVVVWNRFLERATGVPREAAIGKHLHALFPGRARSRTGSVPDACAGGRNGRGRRVRAAPAWHDGTPCAGGRDGCVATIRIFSGPYPPTRRIGTPMATSTASS